MRENNKIICVADVILCFEFVLHELVELVHVHVDQKLTRQVPEW